jgi:hypothetical protein
MLQVVPNVSKKRKKWSRGTYLGYYSAGRLQQLITVHAGTIGVFTFKTFPGLIKSGAKTVNKFQLASFI